MLVNVSHPSKKVVSSAKFTKKNKIYNISLLQIAYKYQFFRNAFTDFSLYSYESIATVWLQLSHDLTMLLQSNQPTLFPGDLLSLSLIYDLFFTIINIIKLNLFEHSTHVENSLIHQ